MSAKSKARLRTDYNIPRTLRLHKDAVTALESLQSKFKGGYIKKQLVTFAIINLDKVVKERGLKAGDNLEEALGV